MHFIGLDHKEGVFMSADIYYFSGTGNSLHVAKELQKRIPEAKLKPIISLLDEKVIEIQAETVGFVFPVYLMSVPAPVRKFLKKLDLKGCRYVFAVATYESAPGMVNSYLNKVLNKKGRNMDSYFAIKMVGNSPKGLMPGFMIKKDWDKKIIDEAITELEAGVLNDLDLISEVILKHEKYPKAESSGNLFLENIIPVITENTKAKIHFYPDSDCTGCGLCEAVCLSRKIKIVDGKPMWQKDVQCFYCYACFNFCPNQSILIKNAYIDKNGRYHHPSITANEIIQQKKKSII